MPGVTRGRISGERGPVEKIGGGLEDVLLIGLTVEPEVDCAGIESADPEVRRAGENQKSDALGRDCEGDIWKVCDDVGRGELPSLGRTDIDEIAESKI